MFPIQLRDSSNKFVVPFPRTNHLKNSFRYNGAKNFSNNIYPASMKSKLFDFLFFIYKFIHMLLHFLPYRLVHRLLYMYDVNWLRIFIVYADVFYRV